MNQLLTIMIGTMGTFVAIIIGFVAIIFSVLRGDIKRSEKRLEDGMSVLHGEVANVRSEAKQSEQRMFGAIEQSEQRMFGVILQSEARTLGVIQQSEERTLGVIQQSEERTLGVIQQTEKRLIGSIAEMRSEVKQSEKRMLGIIQQSEEKTLGVIQQSEKRQDELRQVELDPIKMQVFNHIPTQLSVLIAEKS